LGATAKMRRDGLGGAVQPATLQLNVPTHCMVRYTQDLAGMFQSRTGEPDQALEEKQASCYAHCMQITVHLPDDLAQHPNPGREALEAVVIEGYRTRALSHFEASEILGLSRIQFDGFLKDRKVYDHAYSAEDFAEDSRTLSELQAEGLLRK
jgi:predicted HTH domain antitoxin